MNTEDLKERQSVNRQDQDSVRKAMDALARSIDNAEVAGGALVELNEPSQVGICDQIAKARDILQGQSDRLEGYLFETCWLCQ
jgi:hypothetical protein